MKRIFIVRHGRTEWNLESRFQGANGDSPLLESSKKDCEDLAVFLDKFDFAAIYTSPIRRARVTAELTLSHTKKYGKAPIVDDEDFREVGFGDWEGLTRTQVKTAYPELFDALIHRRDDPRLLAFGIEKFTAARKRFKAGIIRRLQTVSDGQNILIFSHGSISQLGIKALTGNEHLTSLKNTSTSIIQTSDDQHFDIAAYNEAAYLENVDSKGSTTLI
ncbi:MAG: histidine phosphatase family protein [Oenococcus sp.]|uniref:histidine phosphatase family protein n=1 Tax=Oenococcus TaxID=46254 RepID=UPI0021E9826E|nr:histidine phosphatase family protein [Oenococcus kitaharae]MCV3295894.1 histidine phosphatase family protein [Oenococcus kitaharae]